MLASLILLSAATAPALAAHETTTTTTCNDTGTFCTTETTTCNDTGSFCTHRATTCDTVAGVVCSERRTTSGEWGAPDCDDDPSVYENGRTLRFGQPGSHAYVEEYESCVRFTPTDVSGRFLMAGVQTGVLGADGGFYEVSNGPESYQGFGVSASTPQRDGAGVMVIQTSGPTGTSCQVVVTASAETVTGRQVPVVAVPCPPGFAPPGPPEGRLLEALLP